MMKKIIVFFIMSAGAALYAQDIGVEISEAFKIEDENIRDFQWRKTDKKLPSCEKLVFSVYWKFIKVGEAVLEIKGIEEINERHVYHIVSYAKTLAVLDSFYKVRDENHSWLDAESFCSLKFNSDIREGGWNKKQKIDFDHINRKFILDEQGVIAVGDTKRWVLDVLGALYYFRTLEIETGDECFFDVHADKDTWILKTKVTGRETLKTDAGVFDCYVLEPAMRKNAGIFRAEGELKIWISADARKIPVKMKTKIPIGSVTAELVSCEYFGQKEAAVNENIEND